MTGRPRRPLEFRPARPSTRGGLVREIGSCPRVFRGPRRGSYGVRRIPNGGIARLAFASLIGLSCGGDGGGTSPPSPGTTPAPPPVTAPVLSIPTGLMVSTTTEDSITWTWIAVEAAAGYEVQQSTDEVFEDTDPIVRVATTSFTASGLSGSTVVYVRVRAVGGPAEAPLLSDWAAAVTGMSLPPTVHLEASPCTGVVVFANQPRLMRESRPNLGRRLAVVTLEMEFGLGSEDVTIDWVAPYIGDDGVPTRPTRQRPEQAARFSMVLTDWTMDLAPGIVRHVMSLNWPGGDFFPGLEVGVRFRSGNGACPGEPSVICSETGCEVRPAASEPTGFMFRGE